MSISLKIKTATAAISKLSNWPTYFLDYGKMVKDPYATYVFRNGLKLAVRAGTSDRNIVNEVLLLDYYRPAGFEIKKGDTVVDIGAHIGTFSLLASLKAEKVYSFEPAPANFDMLKKNISINNAGNITPLNCAVAGVTGKSLLFLNDRDACMHSVHFESGKQITTNAISLEDIVKDNAITSIDYLKIDCEGSEYEILFNCPEDILQKIKKISAEWHYLDENHSMNALKTFLEKNGFKVEISLKSNSIIHAARINSI